MISTSKDNAPTILKRTVARGRLPNADYRTREYLTEREVERLMKAAGNNRHGHRDATMILLAFRHGLRASELCSLRWDQVDLAHGRLHVSRLKGGIRLFGPHIGRAGLVSFLLKDIHAHDVVTVADQRGVALRGGHHCNQPLMRKLGVESTARASFYFYNTTAEIDRFVEVLGEIQKFFGA